MVSEKQMPNAWFCFLRKTEAVVPHLRGICSSRVMKKEVLEDYSK